MGDKKKFRLHTSNKSTPLLFGLLTDARDYKITWILNQTLGINLKRSEDLIWSHKKLPQSQSFPNYFDDDSRLGKIQLIRNISSAQLRIPEYQQVDYLLVINTLPELLHEAKWLELLRGSPEIRGVYELDYLGLQDLIG